MSDQLDMFGAMGEPEKKKKPKAKKSAKPANESVASLPGRDADSSNYGDFAGEPGFMDPPEQPKPAPRPKPKPHPEPLPPKDTPVRAQDGQEQTYAIPCVRCKKMFEYRSQGSQDILCANCAGVGDSPDPIPDVMLEERCIVIACGCVTMGAEILGHPVCNQHDTDRTREVMATGAWPAWYGYEGKWRVVPTARRLDDMGHTWAGAAFYEKHCSTCQIRYAVWTQERFVSACRDYVQPDTREGLFRP